MTACAIYLSYGQMRYICEQMRYVLCTRYVSPDGETWINKEDFRFWRKSSVILHSALCILHLFSSLVALRRSLVV